jgi:hypothetical protein
MRHTRIRSAQAFEVLWSLRADSKLAKIVNRLTAEIERLDEDNAQLQASVQVYREVLRRYSMGAIPAATPSEAPAIRDAG